MRITIDISDEKLEKVLRLTGISRKSPAISRALDDYLDMVARQEFAALILEKKVRYDATNDEIEAVDAAREGLLDRERP